MKRLVVILALVLVLILIPSGKINSGLATTYFGYCDSAGVGTGSTNIYTTNRACHVVAGYACPDTGAQAVKELGVMTSDDGGKYFHLGIYTAGGSLVAKTTTAKLTVYPAAWVTWNDTELTWVSGTTLTGGTTYILAIGVTTSNAIRLVGTAGSSGVSKYDAEDYSGGMPANLVVGTDDTMIFNVRCGVEPTAAPPSIINNILIIIGRLMLL